MKSEKKEIYSEIQKGTTGRVCRRSKDGESTAWYVVFAQLLHTSSFTKNIWCFRRDYGGLGCYRMVGCGQPGGVCAGGVIKTRTGKN